MSADAPRPSRRKGFRLTRFVRAALGMSAVALTVLGVTQISGTSAAWQDTGNTATSGRLVVSPDVLPAVTISNAVTEGFLVRYCTLTWPHLGPAYTYNVYVKEVGGSFRFRWNTDPGVNMQTGATVTDHINEDDTSYRGSETSYDVEIHTVNRNTGEEGEAWSGWRVRRPGLTWNVLCESPLSGAATADAPSVSGRLGSPSPEAQSAAPTTTASATASPTTTPSGAAPTTPAPTTPTPTTPTPASTSSTTSAAPSSTTSTRPAPTTTTTAVPTTTTTAEADTALGVEKQSPSASYTAALVMPSGTSQPAIAIFDADGEAVARIRSTSAARYEWDSSPDTLWIVDGGRLYKATGGDWAQTAVDPSSSEVPEHITALLG